MERQRAYVSLGISALRKVAWDQHFASRSSQNTAEMQLTIPMV